MRYFSPYPVIADLRGDLGFVAPAKIPDPRKSKANAERFFALWGEWAADREVVLAEWAATLDKLVKLKAATCVDLQSYNREALLHWSKQVVMSVKLIEAGAPDDEVPQPPLPALLAENVRVIDKGNGSFSIQTLLPCPRDSKGNFTSKFPDFSKLRLFGTRDQVTGASTPSGGPPQLGFAAVAARIAAPWAARVFSRIIIAAIGGATIAFTVDRLMSGFRNEEVERMKVDMKRGSEEAGRDRSKFQLNCVELTVKSIGRDLTPDEVERIRLQCVDEALKVNPVVKGQEIGTGGIGMGILLGGLGIAAVLGSFAYFRRRQQE